ncbi:MAG: MMPL family transporter [Chitinispirillaceae bacterium]|nr:MMPL family transporter [Chitinispirillaceae bacterium]
MTNRSIRFLLRYRWPILTLVVLSLITGGYLITTINVDNDTFNAVPPNIKPRIDYERLKKEFPAPFNILFLAQFEQGTLSEKIDSLRSWRGQFGSQPGVTAVTDLTSLQVPVKKGFLGLSSTLIVPPDSTIDEAKVRSLVEANPEFCRLFISDDEKALGMIIAIDWKADRNAILDMMTAKVHAINTSPAIKTYITSEGAVSYFIDKAMHHDFKLLLPICFVLIFLLLYRVFRNMLHVAASVCAVTAALIWTFGIIGFLGIPFTIVTSIIPVIVFPIGVADAIHLIRSFKAAAERKGATTQSALTTTYRELLTPCLLTSLTTSAGFASFVFSPIPWNQTFGLFTAIAVLLCYVFNIVLLPLFLSFEKISSISTAIETTEERLLDRFWNGFIHLTLVSREWMFVIPVLAILFVIGVRATRVENNFMMMLPPGNELRKSDTFMADHFGGTRFFSVMLEKKEGTITTEDDWKRIDTFSTFIDRQEGVGNVASLIPLITRVSELLTKNRFSAAAVKLITAPGGGAGKSYGKFLANFLSADRHRTRIQVICRNESEILTLTIARNIEHYVAEHLSGYTVLVSGPAILGEAMSSILMETLLTSLIATIIPVFFCIVLFFRSLRIGIYCSIPIVLLMGFVYAMLGLCGISINIITVVIMNTCIGIGIDYAIHFVSGYQHAARVTPNRFDALAATIRLKGTPILFNTLVVGVGFCVLLVSSFPPIRDFGLLVFISMFVAAGSCIFIISLAISRFGLPVPPPRKGQP